MWRRKESSLAIREKNNLDLTQKGEEIKPQYVQ